MEGKDVAHDTDHSKGSGPHPKAIPKPSLASMSLLVRRGTEDGGKGTMLLLRFDNWWHLTASSIDTMNQRQLAHTKRPFLLSPSGRL